MRTVWLICLSLLAGCVSGERAPPGPRATLSKEFRLSLGDSIPLDGTPYTVVFEKVLEDSRCPSGVTCVWEGNARIQILLREFTNIGAAGDKPLIEVLDLPVDLNTNSRFPTANKDAGVIIELLKLEPVPRADTPTQGYIVTLMARKP